MSFSTEEIAGEFAAATGGREWFSGDAYSFRRLGKLRNQDLDALATRLRMARLYRTDPAFRQRAIDRARARNHAHAMARISVQPPCPGCGMPVLRKRLDQAYCSGLCRQRAWHSSARRAGRRVT